MTIPRTLSAAVIVELSARLRLACEAIGCKPEAVTLDDLADDQRERLLREGEGDFWKIINERSTP